MDTSSPPPLLDLLVLRAFLLPPGLPLRRVGAPAVVAQQEGPHLASDGRVHPPEKHGLSARGNDPGHSGSGFKSLRTRSVTGARTPRRINL